jgi:acyl carrier protein
VRSRPHFVPKCILETALEAVNLDLNCCGFVGSKSKVGAHRVNIREKILSEMQTIATSHDRQLAPLADELLLLDSGFDSLCFAILIARLEDELQVDPFSATDEIAFPNTLGDMIKLYERAVPT